MATVVKSLFEGIREKGVVNLIKYLRDEGYTYVDLKVSSLFFVCFLKIEVLSWS